MIKLQHAVLKTNTCPVVFPLKISRHGYRVQSENAASMHLHISVAKTVQRHCFVPVRVTCCLMVKSLNALQRPWIGLPVTVHHASNCTK